MKKNEFTLDFCNIPLYKISCRRFCNKSLLHAVDTLYVSTVYCVNCSFMNEYGHRYIRQ